MRYGAKGAEKPALVDAQGTVRDLSGVVADITAETLTPENLKRLAELDASKLPAVASPGRIAPPWSGMGKFICIGLNYSDHAAETGAPIPKEPIIFMKPTSALVGCNDAVVLPQGSVKTDWEVELGVVIGTQGALRREGRRAEATSPATASSTTSPSASTSSSAAALGQGQGLRHLRPGRPVAGDRRRDAGPAGAGDVARRQRQAAARTAAPRR